PYKKSARVVGDVIGKYHPHGDSAVYDTIVRMLASKRGDALGLNDDELAFYDALATNEASVRELGDEILAKIAHELTDSLRANISVDWSSRESVRAKLRILVRRILRKYKYPPDKAEDAAQMILDQTELLCEGWL
ncbi:type I restriction enzyme endonuclease domain-containing protein, partial [Serratia proteamaculans]|uniref:type I restriction enzyme endonuclease domain-containing protein n=1 Tax=Serratia proteamaculans TaxID=28151 RepID=UPI003D07E6A4